MKVTHFQLTNVRTIKEARFRFRPGFNLVVGVNGVGKSTVLDALAIGLSEIVRDVNDQRYRRRSFDKDDIRVGMDIMQIECGFGYAGKTYIYTLNTPREHVVPPKGTEWLREEKQPGVASQIVKYHPEIPATYADDGPESRPLAILFSTNRAMPSNKAPAKGMVAGGVNAAFPDALSDRRELRLGEFEAWIRAQEALSSESATAKRVLVALEDAVTRFLPDYRNLRVGTYNTKKNVLLIDRGKKTLPVQLLSDGERSALTLVLDLTRRLAQANPRMRCPAAETEAIVLIDEIELHLHPEWQRRIVGNLTETFPKCQFIATTHSPQIIGEVKQDHIHIMANGEVYSPSHSFGVDSSRVLEEIMDTDPRNRTVKNLLSEISDMIGDDKYDDARKSLTKLSERLGDNDPEVIRIRTLLDFMVGDT